MTVLPSNFNPRPRRRNVSGLPYNESSNELLKTLQENTTKYVEEGKASTEIEANQEKIRNIDKVLKDFAELQKILGSLRRDLSRHNEALRRRSPKGDRRGSAQGKVIYMEGKPFLLTGNTAVPIAVVETSPPKGDEASAEAVSAED